MQNKSQANEECDTRICFTEVHISSKNAHAKAYAEYEIFNKTQKIESDFDKSVKKLLQ